MYHFYCDDCDLEIEVEVIPDYLICPLCCQELKDVKVKAVKQPIPKSEHKSIPESIQQEIFKEKVEHLEEFRELRRQLVKLGYSTADIKRRIKLGTSLADAIRILEG